MSLPLFSIVGPTASGKTDLALWLAAEVRQRWPEQVTGVDIVSADSRQVYQGIEVISGADIPAGYEAETAEVVSQGLKFAVRNWRHDHMVLWGVSAIAPEAEWSLAYFRALTQQVVAQAQADGRLVMIVGGTGLYHQFATAVDAPLQIAPDPNIRERAAVMELSELQAWVQHQAPAKWELMNGSDRANPRRLVRVLEITKAGLQVGQVPEPESAFPDLRQEWIGVTLTPAELQERITARVAKRWAAGAVAEVESVRQRLAATESTTAAILTATGVREIGAFIDGSANEAEAQQLWLRRELQYAKRQQTWWRKQTQVTWWPALSPTLHQDLLAWIGQKLVY